MILKYLLIQISLLNICCEVLENFESNILELLKDKIDFKYGINTLSLDLDRIFLNGLIRKYRPKKILEIGVCYGGSSIVILNSIKDINGAILYSHDYATKAKSAKGVHDIGFVVDKYAPELKNKWKLFKGGFIGEHIEKIGKDIDLVFLDADHFMPGENLDFLQVLPFLSKNAIVIIHDIFLQHDIDYDIPSNNFLFMNLRGKKILPSKECFDIKYNISCNIGAVILDENQNNYLFDYFYMICSRWKRAIKEKDLQTCKNLFKKYYSEEINKLFEFCINKNYDTLKKVKKEITHSQKLIDKLKKYIKLDF